MFNPYSVRPVGSLKFERHLMDIQTRVYYDSCLSANEGLSGMLDGNEIYGRIPWKDTGADFDPWVSLYVAIWAMTMLDYLDNYLQRNIALREGNEGAYEVFESRCIHMENFFFRKDEFGTRIFENMLYYVCWMGDMKILACKKRIRKLLRWSTSNHKQKGGYENEG